MSDSSDDMEFYSGAIDDDDDDPQEEIKKLRTSLAVAVEALEKIHKRIGSIPFSNNDKWGDVLESVYGKSLVALAQIKAVEGENDRRA